jgi:GNAT superfamily N-acetyltransferase
VIRSEVLQSAEMALRRGGATDLEGLLALQQGAYAKNRPLLGVEPIPLLADYARILRTMEIWVFERDGRLLGALILKPRPDDLLIWSVAVHPSAQGRGIGRALLAAADERARQIGRTVVRLYTGTPLAHLVTWYGRHGYTIERIEALSDRSITHMIKHLGPPLEP